MVKLCGCCGEQRAVLRRPKTFEQLCRECFYSALEEEVHQTIVANRLFRSGERVAVAASGGKDSTVLAHMLTTLNRRHRWGPGRAWQEGRLWFAGLCCSEVHMLGAWRSCFTARM